MCSINVREYSIYTILAYIYTTHTSINDDIHDVYYNTCINKISDDDDDCGKLSYLATTAVFLL